jgi:hypothetical protein
MEIRPQQIFTFELRQHKLRVLWFWREDSDDEQFTLSIEENTLGYGHPGGVNDFASLLPITGPYDEIEQLMIKAIKSAKAVGWRVTAEPYAADTW